MPWCLGFSCLLGCGAKPPPEVSAPPLHSLAAPARAPVQARQTWQRVFYPAIPREARLVELAPNGVRRALLGSFRVELDGSEAHLAQAATLEPISWSCHSGDGWLHLSSDGVVYASSDYLGDLTRVGVSTQPGADLLQCGPEVVLAGQPPVRWTKAGPLSLHAPKPLGFVHFRSALEGEAIAFPDLPFVTHDGGKSFVAAQSAISVLAAAAELPKPYAELEEEAYRAALRAWLRRAVASEAGRALGGHRLSDGTWLRSALAGTSILVALQDPSGKVTSLEVEGQGCQIAPFGARLLAYCMQPNAGLRSIYPPEKPLWNGYPRSHFLGDDAGRFVFALGDGESWPQSNSPLARFDGREWQTYPARRGLPLAARHGWLLLEPFGVVSTEHPEQDGPNLAPHGEQVLGPLSLLEHSVMFVRLTSAREQELVEVELPGGRELRSVKLDPLQGRSSEVGFADEAHGVTWGSTEGGQVALVWSPSEAKFVTMPGADVARHEDYSHVSCNPDSCVLDSVQAFARAAPDRQIALPDPPRRMSFMEYATTPPDPVLTHKTGFDLGYYTCEPEGPAGVFDDLLAYGEAGPFKGLSERLAQQSSDPDQRSDGDLKPLLVARHFSLIERARPSDDSSDTLRTVFVLRGNGQMNALGPEGVFSFEAIPLPNGTVLARTIYPSHQVLILLDEDAAVVKRRAVKLTGQQGDYLALNGQKPGLAVLDDEPPTFISLTPQEVPTPLELPKSRVALPCRGATQPRSLTVFTFDEAQLGWNQSAANESYAVLEVTPRSACLRAAVALSPVWAKVTPRGAALGGTVQGAHRAIPAICTHGSR